MTSSLRSRVVCGLLASVFAAITMIGLSTDARAQGAPDSVSFQGFVTNPGGQPLDTTVAMTFKLYKQGVTVWTETQPAVTVMAGLFNVHLGGVSPLDTVAFDQPALLGITLGGNPEITPRTPLGAAPFALGMRGMHAVWAENGDPSESFSIIGGAPNNNVADGAVGATISGGGGTAFGVPSPNSITGDFSTIGGGIANTASGYVATIAGGEGNTTSNAWASIGGGNGNTASGQEASISGGGFNAASALRSTVGGGNGNTASGILATVGGGSANIAAGPSATVPGGSGNQATRGYTFAAGRRARAQHSGTFVWADSASLTGIEFASTAPEQFLIRAGGGVGIGTNAPGHPLEMASGAHVTAGGVWTDASSRDLKHDFQSVESREVLDRVARLPITRWQYYNELGSVHMGPVAEDFHAAFGLGSDDKHIAALDGNGVALAAIQGLLERVIALEEEVLHLRQRLASE